MKVCFNSSGISSQSTLFVSFFFSSTRRHTRFKCDWSSDVCFFDSSRRRHTRFKCDWSSDVCSSDLRHGKQNEPECRGQRADDERNSCAIARDESAGPTGKKENQKNQRQGGRTGRGCRVGLDLNQIQREQEEKDSDCGIEKESEQVGASETTRCKQRERNHRRSSAGFDECEHNKTAEANNQTPEDQRMPPPRADRCEKTITKAA